MSRLRRLTPLVWIVGVAALAVSLIAAAQGTDTTVPAGGQPATPQEPAGVVCFGEVDVRGGLLQLRPPTFPQPNRVVRVAPEAAEGSRVSAGTVLVEFDDELARLKLREAEAGLAEARGKLAEVNQTADRARDTLRYSIEQQQAAVEAREAQLAAVQVKLNLLKDIRDRGQAQGVRLTSEFEVEEAERNVLALEKGVEVERLKLKQLRETEPDFSSGIEQAEAAIARLEVMVEQARYGVEQMKIVAPSDGVILRTLVREGSQLGPQSQQPAFWFLPDGERIVRVEVDQEFARRVRIGRSAKLYDEHGSQVEWTGEVIEIAAAYLPTRGESSFPNPFSGEASKPLEFLVSLNASEGVNPPKVGQRLRISLGVE